MSELSIALWHRSLCSECLSGNPCVVGMQFLTRVRPPEPDALTRALTTPSMSDALLERAGEDGGEADPFYDPERFADVWEE